MSLIASCELKEIPFYKSHKESDSILVAMDSLIEKPEFQFNSFTDFPDAIDGCSCYFSTDKTEFEKPNYVYVDDYDKHAYVSINGKMTKFTLVTADTASEKTILKVFANDQYEVTIYGKQVSQMDETWQYEGTMVVKEIDGKSISKTIYGECGC